MLDLQYLFPQNGADIQIFAEASPGNVNSWATWCKPRGTSMCYMFVLGGGGSGAGGTRTAAGQANSGGGGGGSGGQSSLLIPAIFLPDTLYIQVGAGGTPVAANTGGISGAATLISVKPFANITGNTNGLLLIGNGGGAGGTPLGANAGGAAGAAGAIATIASCPLSTAGFVSFLVGQAGTLGGANTATAGGALTPPVTGLLTMGGTGGGGQSATTNAAGGAITSVAFDQMTPAIPGGAAPGGAGSNGLKQFKPLMFFSGGTGSGSNTQGAVLDAGAGSHGAGGGRHAGL
jgi:hypothetical protein